MSESTGLRPRYSTQYERLVANTKVDADGCWIWTGAVSGRTTRERTDRGGHGRFWFAQGRVINAHRFEFAVMHGVEALDDARLLGHRCDNPLCQRIAPDHVVVSCAAQNRREWSNRRNLPDGPLADPCGPRDERAGQVLLATRGRAQ